MIRPARRVARLALLAPLLALGSCAWLSDRAGDLADVVVVEASAGLGLAADVKLTDLLHVGAGYAHARKVGLRGREAELLWDREVGLPLSLVPWLGAARDGEWWRVGHLHANAAELWHGSSPWRLFDLEVGLFAGVLGLRLGLSPGELVDFLAGLIGFDPAGDDAGPPAAPAPRDGAIEEEGLWLVGDLHDHCHPPDGGHAPVSPAETHALAAANGLDFVGINPHLWFEGEAPAARADLQALAREVRALEGQGPIVIPGLEVMLRGRGAGPFGAGGHVLLLFRDLEDAYAFSTPGAEPAEDERAWVRERLATLAPDERLWVPAHPWPHPRLRIPFFPDWAADWKQVDELPDGGATLEGREYARWATPWRERARRREDPAPWRLVRYRLAPAAREGLAVLAPGDARETAALGRALDPEAVRAAAWKLVPAPADGEALGELRRAEAALGQVLARELAAGPAGGPLALEVALDVGRNAWLWVRLGRDAAGELELALSYGATPLGVDGRPHPALHDVPVDGFETLSGLVHLASLAVGRRGEELDLAQAFALLERRMLAERRRLVPLAGSDNHRDLVFPTLWAFARERSREAVFDALRAGRVCVGGPEASSLRARTDLDPTWRAVGAAPRADRWVELRWEGEAELFVDGRSLGLRRGGYREAIEPGAFRLYRIVRGRSWSGWIYVNAPGAEAPSPPRPR